SFLSIRISLIALLLPVLAIACSQNNNQVPANSPNSGNTNSIILFIGDGMGSEQRKAALWYSAGLNGTLNMDTLSYAGNAKTASIGGALTDSAAAGTAMSTGTKTSNGFIAMGSSQNTLQTILEIAQLQGKSTGLITTTQIPHATPATFAAHISDRKKMIEIASQIIDKNIDVLFGGGESYFIPNTEIGNYPAIGKRTDSRNLINEAVSSGYTYVYDRDSFLALDTESKLKVIGIFSDEGMTRPFSPTLEEMTQAAINILEKNPKGFFLMVEGGQIDWAGHANEALNNMQDTLDFDAAVNIGINYQSKNSNTLLIVTADHGTGGMSASLTSTGASDEDGPYNMPDNTPFYINWSTKGHSAVDVPVNASGPSSELLTGTFENTFIFDVMKLQLRQ
ncbi:Alkaline phosphatase, partial [hydrothermal vent metagenome]